MPHIDERRPDEHIAWTSSIAMLVVMSLPLLAVFTGVTWKAVWLGVGLYLVRMFFITAGYHRYFAHRSYRLGRPMQFVMAFGGTMAAQKGPLWWAGAHRDHHRYSDTPNDYHSPRKGFWFSQIGWILAERSKPKNYERIADFAKYPELRFIDRFDWIGPWALGIASFVFAGLPGLFVGFFGSTLLLWHGTFTVNSLAHVIGRRRFATDDTSRNSALVALITGGEGWHNNHHHYPASARQGFYWWEYDITFYGLKALSWIGLVKDLRVPNEKVLDSRRLDAGTFDRGMYRDALDRAAAVARAAESTIGAAGVLEITSSLADADQAAHAETKRRVVVAEAAPETLVTSS